MIAKAIEKLRCLIFGHKFVRLFRTSNYIVCARCDKAIVFEQKCMDDVLFL